MASIRKTINSWVKKELSRSGRITSFFHPSLIEKTAFVIFATGGMFAFIFLWINFHEDPRMSDNRISITEMNWWEIIFFFYIFLGISSNWVVSTKHAFLNNKYKWGWLILFIWPTSFIYTWKVYLASNHSAKVNT